MVREQYGADVEAVAAGTYDSWLSSSLPEGLAGVILMDQFTRNMYRGTAQMCGASLVPRLHSHPRCNQLDRQWHS